VDHGTKSVAQSIPVREHLLGQFNQRPLVNKNDFVTRCDGLEGRFALRTRWDGGCVGVGHSLSRKLRQPLWAQNRALGCFLVLSHSLQPALNELKFRLHFAERRWLIVYFRALVMALRPLGNAPVALLKFTVISLSDAGN
jgi:hypothetical protein